jgi:ComF family protein
VDFLFPKDPAISALESLSPSDLLSTLPPAPFINADTIAIFAYGDSRVRMLVWELKYRRNTAVARLCASILLDVVRYEMAERSLTEGFAHPLLVPMPISTERLRERGWNQTEALCNEALRIDPHFIDYRPDVLTKTHYTDSQARTKSKRVRLTNVEHTMTASPDVRGRAVVLVDDVTTTGATVREARRALKAAGAKKILAITLAH